MLPYFYWKALTRNEVPLTRHSEEKQRDWEKTKQIEWARVNVLSSPTREEDKCGSRIKQRSTWHSKRRFRAGNKRIIISEMTLSSVFLFLSLISPILSTSSIITFVSAIILSGLSHLLLVVFNFFLKVLGFTGSLFLYIWVHPSASHQTPHKHKLPDFFRSFYVIFYFFQLISHCL